MTLMTFVQNGRPCKITLSRDALITILRPFEGMGITYDCLDITIISCNNVMMLGGVVYYQEICAYPFAYENIQVFVHKEHENCIFSMQEPPEPKVVPHVLYTKGIPLDVIRLLL